MKSIATLFLIAFFCLPFGLKAFDLTNFAVQPDHNRNVLLSWTTTTEANNKAIEVQYSHDGINFQTISRIVGEARANLSKTYQFRHNGLQGGQHFYRLRQITLSGDNFLSAVRKIVIPKIIYREILIAANPIKGDIIKVKVASTHTFIDFHLTDEQGTIIYKTRIDETDTQILIDMNVVDAGQYRYKLFSGKEILNRGTIELLK